MPNTEPELNPRIGVGAPSPPEAWQVFDHAPSWQRNPFQFLKWVREIHSETVSDNPVFRKTWRVRYVKHRRRLHPLLSDTLVGMVFGAIALGVVYAGLKLGDRRIPDQFFGNYFLAVGAIYLLGLAVGGLRMVRAMGVFISTTDKAMVWEDLIMTALREEHFLWGWIWSPLLSRMHHILLAVVWGTFGILMSPYQITRIGILSEHTIWITTAVFSLLLLSLAMMATSLGLAVLGLIQKLDLGPSLFDISRLFWNLFMVAPFFLGLVLEAFAIVMLIAGFVDDPFAYAVSCIFSLCSLFLTLIGSWMLLQELLSPFWEAIVARREVRHQRSWFRSLFGK